MFLYELMPVQKAEKILRSNLNTAGKEIVNLDQTHHRVLAQNVVSLLDAPPFDRSAMDGYAVRAEETFGHSEENPVQLKIVDRIGAGECSHGCLHG